MDGNVQTDAASEGVASIPPASVTTQEQAAQAPLTVEALQKVLAEEREAAKRAIQSAKDSALAEVQRARWEAAQHAQKARTAEGSLQKVKQRFEEDPETQEKIELEELKAWKQMTAEQQQAWEQSQQSQAVDQQFYQDMGESLRTLGVNLTDKRIDWAVGVPDYKQRMMKIMASANTILRQDTQVREKKMKQDLEERLAAVEKNLGVHKIDTSVGKAGMVGDIPLRKDAFAQWVRGLTPDEYAKRKPDIDALMRSDKIKE